MHPHKALTVPEILQEIFQHLSPHPGLSLSDAHMEYFEFPPFYRDAARRSRMTTLARVARTCKVFSEPASRILWAVQDGRAPAVSVLKNNVSGSIVGVMY